MAIIKRPDKKGQIRYQVRLGAHKAKTFDTRREARDYEASLRLKRKPKASMTCAELVDRYNALWEEGQLPRQDSRPKQATRSTRRQHLALFVAEFGDLDVNELDPLHVESWATTHRWAVTSVNPIFNYAIKRNIVGHNDFAQYMPQTGEGRKHIAVLSDDELPQAAQALSHVPGISGPLFQTVWGRRLSNTNMSATYWRKTRQVYAPCSACGAEKPKDCTACAGSGYAETAPDIYDLRHWCAHLLYVRMDLPSRDVAAQLGNSPTLIENLYGHWKQGATDRLRAAVKANGVPQSYTSSAHEVPETPRLQAVSE